jgi:hypothetical protein
MASGSAMAQDITGDWQGTLKVGTTELRLVMEKRHQFRRQDFQRDLPSDFVSDLAMEL